MSDEKLYRCPACKSGPRPRDEWASRYGIMTCGICLNKGAVIMPEEYQGDYVAPAHVCPKCGGTMAHYRLKGYRCPRCD